jgi:hypothetical protein
MLSTDQLQACKNKTSQADMLAKASNQPTYLGLKSSEQLDMHISDPKTVVTSHQDQYQQEHIYEIVNSTTAPYM